MRNWRIQMTKFFHLKFLRNLKKNNLLEIKKQGKLSSYLIFDYFDYLIFEESSNIQDCAFGKEIPNRQNEFCEAYQGLGLFCEESAKAGANKMEPVRDDNPITCGNKELPFLSIFQLTINPFYYKQKNEDNVNDWIERLETVIQNTFSTDNDQVVFQIYQTVNAADFCIIIVSKKLNYIEQLSSNLNEITFSLGDKKYIAFTIYENIGLHKCFDEKLVKEAFSKQHALIARIRTKDSYRNGLEGKYLEKWQNNYRCSILSGRYHISARIETAEEILMTLNDIAAYKFGEPVNNSEGEVNIVRRLLMEGKAEYLNERILYGINIAKTSLSKEPGQEIQIPEYDINDSLILDNFEVLHGLIQDIKGARELQTYIEKLENIYYMQKELSGNPDTHISCRVFTEYFEAFLNGLVRTCQLILGMDLENCKDDFIEHISSQVKVALRYMTQFADIISSVNTTTFQAPKYELIQDMNASPKFVIAYAEFLREKVDGYRKQMTEEDDVEIFPYYIPLIIPKMTEVAENFYMTILYAQGFTDDWEKEREVWKAYIDSGMKTPLFVVTQKYKMISNVSDVLTLAFHELGHYCNNITRQKRNQDLLIMISKCLSGIIVKEFRETREADHFLNRTEEASGIIKHFQVLTECLEKEFYDFIEKDTEKLIDVPAELFLSYIINRIEALLSPKPSYYGKDTLYENTLKHVIDKTIYHFPNAEWDSESMDGAISFQEKGKRICLFAFQQCQEELNSIKERIDSAEELFASHQMKSYNFQIYIRKYIKLIADAIDEYIEKDEPNKYRDPLNEYGKKIEETWITIKTTAINRGYTDEAWEILKGLHELYKQTFEIQKLLREYDLLMKVFEDPRINTPPECDLYSAKKELIEKVYEHLYHYFTEHNLALNSTSSLTLWERQMLERLQLTGNIEKEHFCRMMDATFFRAKGIGNSLAALSMIYSEGFADLSMCKELDLTLKEYLIVIAEFVKFETRAEDNYRLFAIIIVVIVRMFDNDKTLDDWEKAYTSYPGRFFLEKFLENKQSYMQEIGYENYEECKRHSDNTFVQRFQKLVDYIEINITDIGRNTTVRPMLQQLIECSRNEKKETNDNEIGFVKMHLNYHFAKSFDITEEYTEMEILKNEIQFVMKYYYKNRKRYMEGET